MCCDFVATWFSGELLIFAFGKTFLCVWIYNIQLSSGFNVSLNLLDDCDGLNLYEWVTTAWQNSFKIFFLTKSFVMRNHNVTMFMIEC